MNPQKYCISLDLAKRLHELGVKKRSLFYWSNEDNEKEPWKIDFSGYAVSRNGVEVAHYPAYTSGELGEMLPVGCFSRKSFDDDRWFIDMAGIDKFFYGDTEAEARGLMLDYLIKNGFVTLEK